MSGTVAAHAPMKKTIDGRMSEDLPFLQKADGSKHSEKRLFAHHTDFARACFIPVSKLKIL
jgi:hypothetical protein